MMRLSADRYAQLVDVQTNSTSDATAQSQGVVSASLLRAISPRWSESFVTVHGRVVAHDHSGNLSTAFKRQDYWIPAAGASVAMGAVVDVDGKAEVDNIGIVSGGGTILNFTGDIQWSHQGLAATNIEWRATFVIEISWGPSQPAAP